MQAYDKGYRSSFCTVRTHWRLWYASTLVKTGHASFESTIKVLMVLILAAFGVAETVAMAPDFAKSSQLLALIFQILGRRTEIDPNHSVREQVSKTHMNRR